MKAALSDMLAYARAAYYRDRFIILLAKTAQSRVRLMNTAGDPPTSIRNTQQTPITVGRGGGSKTKAFM